MGRNEHQHQALCLHCTCLLGQRGWAGAPLCQQRCGPMPSKLWCYGAPGSFQL